jgi:hypothetical protein
VKVADAIEEVAEEIERKRKGISHLEFLRRLVNQSKPWQARTAEDRVLARGIIARKELEDAEGGSWSASEVAKVSGCIIGNQWITNGSPAIWSLGASPPFGVS